MMSLVVVIAWVLYVDIKLNYNINRLVVNSGQIVDVMKRHLSVIPWYFITRVLLFQHCYLYYLHMLQGGRRKVLLSTPLPSPGGAGCAFSMLFLSKIIDKNSKGFYVCSYFYGFYTIHGFIFGLSLVTNIYRFGCAIFIGLMYGILPAWNTFMAGQIDALNKEDLGRI